MDDMMGYSLLELLTVIAIMAIIIAMVATNFLPQFQRLEANYIENELRNFLVDGKQNALIYQTNLILCIADDSQQCVLQNGEFLLSFIDKNSNQRFDTGDKLLNNRNITLRFGKLLTRVGINRAYVTVSADTGNPIGYMGHFAYCPTNRDSNQMFKVTFNMTGIIKTKKNSEETTACP